MPESIRARILILVAIVVVCVLAWPDTDDAPSTTTPQLTERKRKRATRPSPVRPSASASTTLNEDEEPPEEEIPDDPDPDGTIRCPVDGSLDSDGRFFIRLLSASAEAESFSWYSADNSIVLTGAPASGTAVLRMRGHPRVEFEWGEEGCGPIKLGQTALIRGVVIHAFLDDTRRAGLRGCGARGPIEEDGSFELKVSPEPCELVARRHDGPLMAVSEPIFLEPEVGDIIEVELRLPAYKMAGVGFSWQMIDGAVDVVGVHPDTPASDVGLENGDTILEVDGYSTEDMNRGDFRRTVGGEEGSTVRLLVLRGEREVHLAFERESLDHAIPERDEGSGGRGKWGKRPW